MYLIPPGERKSDHTPQLLFFFPLHHSALTQIHTARQWSASLDVLFPTDLLHRPRASTFPGSDKGFKIQVSTSFFIHTCETTINN